MLVVSLAPWFPAFADLLLAVGVCWGVGVWGEGVKGSRWVALRCLTGVHDGTDSR